MLTCREVAEQASEYLDRELSWSRRLGVRLHLMMCRHCRAFLANLATSIALTRRAADQSIEVPQHLVDNILGALEGKLGGGNDDAVGEAPAASTGAGHGPPRLRLVQGAGNSDPRVARIFREIESVQGTVSNLFRAYAHHPDVLESTWNRLRAVMLQGTLSRRLKECIAVVVSSDNGCRYCIEHHSRVLRSMGMAQEEIDRLVREPLAGNFDPKERALLALARQANRDPHGASDFQVEVARRAGATDAEIIEALAVMELFLSFNRFLDTLDIPLENDRPS
jgi:uncharacterized peroxidase-related enzyme